MLKTSAVVSYELPQVVQGLWINSSPVSHGSNRVALLPGSANKHHTGPGGAAGVGSPSGVTTNSRPTR